MATTEQLEREAEATRAQIAATLDELRGRMTPGQVVDELLDYARDSGGGEFFRNFGRQVVDNPVPVTLVGAGLAWLMMAGRGGALRRGGATGHDVTAGMSDAGRPPRNGDQSSATTAGLSDHAVRRAQQWAQQTRATATELCEGAAEIGASLQETAGAAGAAVRDTASAAYATGAERSRHGADAVARGARSVSDSIAAGGQGLLNLLQEQPLVLAGLGLAIGSLLGAALPITDTENQVMGEASDAAKSDVKARAAEQVEMGKAVAAEAWGAAKPELDAQLRGHEDGRSSGSADDTRPAGASSVEATLVPADQDGQGGGASHAARRQPEHPGG